MSERPERVTVVSWLILVFSGFGILGLLMMTALPRMPTADNPLGQYLSRMPLSLPVLITIGAVSTAVTILCAVGFLRRISWARHVYVALNVMTLTHSFWLNYRMGMPYMPWLLLPGMILPAAVCFCVYSKPAREWFNSKTEPVTRI